MLQGDHFCFLGSRAALRQRAVLPRRAAVVRMGKLEATAEEVRALHIDMLAERREQAEGGVASAQGECVCPSDLAHRQLRVLMVPTCPACHSRTHEGLACGTGSSFLERIGHTSMWMVSDLSKRQRLKTFLLCLIRRPVRGQGAARRAGAGPGARARAAGRPGRACCRDRRCIAFIIQMAHAPWTGPCSLNASLCNSARWCRLRCAMPVITWHPYTLWQCCMPFDATLVFMQSVKGTMPRLGARPSAQPSAARPRRRPMPCTAGARRSPRSCGRRGTRWGLFAHGLLLFLACISMQKERS